MALATSFKGALMVMAEPARVSPFLPMKAMFAALAVVPTVIKK